LQPKAKYDTLSNAWNHLLDKLHTIIDNNHIGEICKSQQTPFYVFGIARFSPQKSWL